MEPYPISAEALVSAVQAEVDAISEDVRDRFGVLAAEQLAWQPSPDQWGVGQCLVHIARANELYRVKVAPALRRARTRGLEARRPLHGSWLGRWFTRIVGPEGRPAKAPPLFRPRRETVEGAALETFFAEQVRLQGLLDDARGLDLDRVRVPSPLSRLLRFHVGDVFRMLVEHEKRHVLQAVRVRSEPAFPS